jgi:hypothetical protein
MKEHVQSRRIEINSFDVGDGRIQVEGRLRDWQRPRLGGSLLGPFLVHDIRVCITVNGYNMAIEAVEGEMCHQPRNGCSEVLPLMGDLVGVEVTKGFAKQVKELIGGVRGCTHVRNLVINLGPAALQGFWCGYLANKVSGFSPNDPRIQKYANSCLLWREDGPLVNEPSRYLGYENVCKILDRGFGADS